MNNLLNYLLIASLFALAGLWLGIRLTEDRIINEVDRWHVAKMYEDGSWQVEYKDGSKHSGCTQTGLCQD